LPSQNRIPAQFNPVGVWIFPVRPLGTEQKILALN
jgi:hypothetical protein